MSLLKELKALNLMMKGVFFFVFFISCSSIEETKSPLIEMCITGNNIFICQDDRKALNEYEKPIEENYICTNASDFSLQKKYIIELEKRIKICMTSKKKCQ